MQVLLKLLQWKSFIMYCVTQAFHWLKVRFDLRSTRMYLSRNCISQGTHGCVLLVLVSDHDGPRLVQICHWPKCMMNYWRCHLSLRLHDFTLLHLFKIKMTICEQYRMKNFQIIQREHFSHKTIFCQYRHDAIADTIIWFVPTIYYTYPWWSWSVVVSSVPSAYRWIWCSVYRYPWSHWRIHHPGSGTTSLCQTSWIEWWRDGWWPWWMGSPRMMMMMVK